LGIGWKGTVDALVHWRSAVEEVGIYVFKRSFKQREVSGFCLLDADYPLIVLNNSSSFARQIFTLFHELGHLLLQVSGVCKVDDSYIEQLSGDSKRIEVLCNRFAAEFLVPREDFDATTARLDATERSIALLANRYKVSRPVIAKRFLDAGKLSQGDYRDLLEQYTQDYYRNRGEESGGNYYSTQAAYLSRRYADVVLTRLYEGKIDRSAVADYFGVKATSLPRLEQALLGRTERG
jgi:Zn-dependent peptidase ImmA (M78 family)